MPDDILGMHSLELEVYRTIKPH